MHLCLVFLLGRLFCRVFLLRAALRPKVGKEGMRVLLIAVHALRAFAAPEADSKRQ